MASSNNARGGVASLSMGVALRLSSPSLKTRVLPNRAHVDFDTNNSAFAAKRIPTTDCSGVMFSCLLPFVLALQRFS